MLGSDQYASAIEAGAKAALHEMKGVGHAFPESQYPVVRAWLRGEPLPESTPVGPLVAPDGKADEQTKIGSVIKVDVDRGQLTVMVARELTFTLTDRTTITQEGKPRKLAEIKPQDQVSVVYVREGDTRTAHQIVILKARGEGDPSKPIQPLPASQVQTATKHPMKYYISLPPNWSPNRTWPVLVAPNAHYGDKGKNLALFAAERDRRKADFIIIQPLVINADRVATMTEYRGAVADAISAADAVTPAGSRRPNRNDVARAKFDSKGIRAIIKDVQRLYRGEDKIYITGFSSSTHIAYMFLFAHPELLKGVIINSGVYLGRGVDEEHIPFLNSPERASLAIKYIIGEKDPGYDKCLENWTEAKTTLLSWGHPASKIQEEIIKPGNPEQLGAGHQWFPTKILDFCCQMEK